jgi:hypothetical protein
MKLWEKLKDYYILCPVMGIIQLEHGQICKIPKEIISIELEGFWKGNWSSIAKDKDFYPYLHNSLDWPLSELLPNECLFVLFDENVPSFEGCEIEITDNSIIIEENNVHSIPITSYALVRERIS